MKYAFVLGRVYTLSIAELVELLNKKDDSLGLTGLEPEIVCASEEILLVELPQAINVHKLQKNLGGVVKILQVIDEVKKRPQDSLNFALKHYFRPSLLKKQFLKEYKGKIQFGLSVYLLNRKLADKPEASKNGMPSMNIFSEPKRLGMMVKKTLTDMGFSARLVLPEMNSLSLASVAVTKNLLLEKGSEICILAGEEILYTAKTLVVQDFEDYGRRDYQRPIRDEKQGMIPPKVAQVMLNLSGAKTNDTILDPFCGIGTMIQEGLLLGFRMIGSDINKFAIKGSIQNLEWFKNRYHISQSKFGLEVSDATQGLNKLITDSGAKISAIVTEGTLGPVYSAYPTQKEIEMNFDDLIRLYKKAFKEFSLFLPEKAKIVMCIPAYKKGRDSYTMLPSLDWASTLGYNSIALIPAKIAKKMKFLRLSARGTAIYDRKDQIVAREIAIFEKN